MKIYIIIYKEIILTNDFEIHIIELPKALKEYEREPKNVVMQWMKFLENPNDMEVRKIMEKNKDIKKAGEKLEEISSDETLRRLAELREKGIRDEAAMRETAIRQGLEEGIRRGIEQGKREEKEIANKERKNAIKNLLKLGVEKEKIAESYGITLEEVEKSL